LAIGLKSFRIQIYYFFFEYAFISGQFLSVAGVSDQNMVSNQAHHQNLRSKRPYLSTRVAPLPTKSKKRMTYLVLAILCSVIIGILFKLFPRYGIDTFQAIIVNYFTCVACSTVQNGRFVVTTEIKSLPWFWYALALGIVFITGFTLAAATVRYFSVTISQIMQKMSILISVPFALFAYHESAGWMKLVGILFAIIAIILVNIPPKIATESVAAKDSKLYLMPLLTWLLAGVIEVVFVIVQKEKMIALGDSTFITTVFFTAGCLGLTYLLYLYATKAATWSWRNVIGGIALGIPNYGSMYFLLQGLSSGMESSIFFPLNNMGIILLTVAVAVLAFRDRLTKLNWVGVCLTVVALWCMNN
jgi:drug/metabolite transporter (DMT)-like permease